jgi:hypothetical protein
MATCVLPSKAEVANMYIGIGTLVLIIILLILLF